MKKVLLFILSITMVITTVLPIVPFSAATVAEDEAETVTYETISTAEDLAGISLTGNYKIADGVTEIDVTGTEGFPIAGTFTGIFDGNGATITGLTTPLFDTVTGTVKNVTVNSNITYASTADDGISAMGIVAMWAKDSAVFENITTTGSFIGDYTARDTVCTGGLVGAVTMSNNSTINFRFCTNNATINATKPNKTYGVGGIVGQSANSSNNKGIISFYRCYNNGNITISGGSASAAGIIGRFNEKSTVAVGYIVECANTANISHPSSGSEGVSGIAGFYYEGVISRCYNTGELSSNKGTQGMIAYSKMTKTKNVIIEYCYNATETALRYEIAYVNATWRSIVRGNCYVSGRTAHYDSGTPVSADEPDIACDYNNPQTFVDALKDHGYIAGPDGFPVHADIANPSAPATQIASADDFVLITANPTANYELTADITVSTPINGAFYGMLNGNGHTITVTDTLFTEVYGTVKNLNINANIDITVPANSARIGVAALSQRVASNAVIENITVNGSINVNCTDKQIYVGGMVALVDAGCLDTIRFKNCTNNADIHVVNPAKLKSVGGIFGQTNDSFSVGTIELYRCINNGNLSADGGTGAVAGLVGRFSERQILGGTVVTQNETAIVTECVNTGTITRTNFSSAEASAGLFGYFRQGKISKCYNIGDVNHDGYAYGLIGYSALESLQDGTSYKRSLTIEYCYNAAPELTADLGRVRQVTSGKNPTSAKVNCYTGDNAWTGDNTYAASTAIACESGDAILGVLGDCGYVADVNNQNGGYPILAFQFEDAIAGATIAGFTANLGGSIGLNFHMNISSEILADESAYVIFTSADRYTKIAVADGATSSNNAAYKVYTCEVAAKEMTAPITVQVVTANGNSPVYTYTVAKYAAKVANGNFTAEEKALASAMLDYGTEAQLRFDYNTDNLASADKEITAIPESANIASYVKTIGGDAISGITSSGTTAVLDSEIAIRYYFEFGTDVDTTAYTFKYAGKALTLQSSENGYYVEIANISAKNYDKSYTVSVTSAEGTMTVSTSVYAYINSILTEGPAESAEVAEAAYWYCEAAKAYFAK